MRDTIVPSPRELRLLWLSAVLLVCAASSLGAQSIEIAIAGTVRGDDGSVPSHAIIDVLSRATGARRHLVADARGHYVVLALDPGSYDVTASALGYRPGRRAGVTVVLGERTRIDFTLARGAIALAPTVVTADRRADVSRADVSTAVLPDDIRDLPLDARNVLDVAVVAPGVRTHAGTAGGVPSAGPTNSGRFVNLYLDGVETKGLSQGNIAGAGAGSIVSPDAIQEFRIMLDPYDVEYGDGSAWLVSAVTWQGSNTVAGSLFAYGQNRDLVATRSFAAGKPRYARAQLGASLRGPIVHDHLFFALTVERDATDNFLTVVPGRPAANPGLWDGYAGTFPAPTRNELATVRLTAPHGGHTFDLSTSVRHLTSDGGFGVRSGTVMLGYEAGIHARHDLVTSRLRDSWSKGHVANELALDYLASDDAEAALHPGPAYRYPGLQRGGISTEPTRTVERHLGLTEKVVASFSALGIEHVIKVGGEVRRGWGWGFQPANHDGLFAFASDTSRLPSSATVGVGFYDSSSTRDARTDASGWLLDGYAQEQLRPVFPITLTLGLRWDAHLDFLNQSRASPFAGDTTLQRVVGDWYLNDGDRRNTLNDFAPRASAVWDVGSEGLTFLRAGYGIMYDRVPVYGAFFERLFWQWRTYTISSPGTTDVAVLRKRAVANAPSLHLFPDRMKTPSTRQWSVGFGRRLGDGAALNVDYIDQHMRNVYVTVRANVAPGMGRPRPLTPRYGDLYLWGDFGDGTYHGLLTSFTVDRPRSRLTIAYTLAGARSDFNIASTNDFPDSSDYRMQRSVADERHRLVITEAARFGWGVSVSAIGVLASPQPYVVTLGTDANHNGVMNDDWPNGLRTARNGGSNNWFRDLDVRLGKTARAPRGELAMTAEIFNVFNVGNHAEYQGVQNLLGYQRAVADYPRREAQLGLRYSF